MQQFAIIFLSILLEALPFVLIGTILSSLIEIFVSREWLTDHLPRKSIFAYLAAGLAGILFPVCECAIVPIMRRLVKKGMPIGVAITFMLATPTINPIVLLSTYFAFSGNIYFPILRGVMGYLVALSVGLLMAFLSDKKEQKELILAGDLHHKDGHGELCSCGHSHGEEAEARSHKDGHGELCSCGHSHGEEAEARSHKDGYGELCSCGHSHGEEAEVRSYKDGHGELCSCGHSHGEEAEARSHKDGYGELCSCGHSHGEEAETRSHKDGHGEVCSCGHIHEQGAGKRMPGRLLKSILEHTSTELYEVGRFLILGVLISAAMQTFVPKQYFLALSEKPALSIVAMMLLAFVLSLCSEADAFIAAGFRSGLPNSALLAFLIFGPMMDIKNMLMLSQGFRTKFIVRLILAIGVMVFIFSSLAGFLF